MNKEDIRQLVKQLTEVVKHKPVVYQAIDNIEAKFDVLAYSAQPFKAAVKVWDIELLHYLIDRGALDAPLAVKAGRQAVRQDRARLSVDARICHCRARS